MYQTDRVCRKSAEKQLDPMSADPKVQLESMVTGARVYVAYVRSVIGVFQKEKKGTCMFLGEEVMQKDRPVGGEC